MTTIKAIKFLGWKFLRVPMSAKELEPLSWPGGFDGASGGGAVSSVNGQKGAVVLTGDDLQSTLSGTGPSVTATVTEHLQTLKNDENELGEQVAGIQSLIPNNASSANLLATKKDISGAGGSTDDNGLEGDYSTTYGIVDETKSGLPSIISDNKIKIPAQLVLDVPGVDGLTIVASNIFYDIKSTTDCTLFLANGEVLEATDVYFQTNEPQNGVTGFAAWWNGEQWYFKSNDTGNVFRPANAVRIAKCIFTNGSLTRLCFTGCRALNRQEYLPLIGGTLTGGIRVLGTSKYDTASFDLIVCDVINPATGKQAILNIGVDPNGNMSIATQGSVVISNSLYGSGDNPTLGHFLFKWKNIYTTKLNNGRDIVVPNTAGTMVVATPPTAAGTYVLKATVDDSGNVTTAWVANE